MCRSGSLQLGSGAGPLGGLLLPVGAGELAGGVTGGGRWCWPSRAAGSKIVDGQILDPRSVHCAILYSFARSAQDILAEMQEGILEGAPGSQIPLRAGRKARSPSVCLQHQGLTFLSRVGKQMAVRGKEERARGPVGDVRDAWQGQLEEAK